jgi:diguanylate cyclase (GGDEF)-like protein
VAEKLRQTVEELAVTLEDGTVLQITVSIGLAAIDPQAEWSPSALELLGEADKALYRAKGAGRNRIEPAAP